jgi:CubicO group peptidase (beta-lactamase class C family)
MVNRITPPTLVHMLVNRRAVLSAGIAMVIGPFTGAGHGLLFTPGRRLRPAERPAAYHRRVVEIVGRGLRPSAEHPGHPRYAGAVALTAVDGVITTHVAVGDALRYGPGPAELPTAQRVAMRTDSVFDLASLTKVFTSLVSLRLVEGRLLDLAAPVGFYLPDFRGRDKAAVTVSMLLAHTSGAPAGINVTGCPDVASRRSAIVAEPLRDRPGTRFVYSDINLMLLGLIVEAISGYPLDELVRLLIVAPLGLRDTGFRPLSWLPEAEWPRLVATETTCPLGVVHDGNARSLSGVAGHAGLFSTAHDLAVVCQMLINGGEYGGHRLLGEPTVRAMLTDVNRGLPAADPGRVGRTSAHGLGVDLDQPWYMGRLASPSTFGHTGFTGTSFAVDPARRATLVLLTNRIHPRAEWGAVNATRAALGDVLAVIVAPAPGAAWHSGRHD